MSSEDKEVGAILRRHHEDAAWFGSGLHDPNGYIYMAHKDRGELLAKLRMLRTGDAAPVDPGDAIIWGNGWVYTEQHREQEAARNAALRFMLDNLHEGYWAQAHVVAPRPLWRRILDRIAA